MNLNRAKKNNIWSNALVEDSLCQDIGKFSSIQNDENLIKVSNRDVESYEYSIDEPTNNETTNTSKRNHLAIDTNLVNFVKTEKKSPVKSITVKEEPTDRIEIKKRLGALVTFDESKSRAHISVTEIDSEDLVAKEIAKYLQENNFELIGNFFIVNFKTYKTLLIFINSREMC